MSNSLDLIRKNFGFGFMRLPMSGDRVDIPQTCRMVDEFLEAGFNYFDTAHDVLDGGAETAFRECVAKRFPRERYVIADKLKESCFMKQPDIRPLFESQLEACGVEYFDFYLMHAQNSVQFEKFKKCRAWVN
mgnify:CR=1 FL=1